MSHLDRKVGHLDEVVFDRAVAGPSPDVGGDDDAAPLAEPTRRVAELTPPEELQLQQLLQTRFWLAKTRALQGGPALDAAEVGAELPERWELTGGITLHDWQRRCVDAWFANAGRGIIKVVTGAGKTVLALGIAEKLQREGNAKLRVAIVVPTVVLLEQWHEELVTRGNLPADAVGLLGGGHSGAFRERTRVLVCVLHSAAAKLAGEVERAGISRDLLLVVDECHRAGAAEMQRVFRTERAYSLGLSATPERDDDGAAEADDDGRPSDDASEDASGEVKRATAFEETTLGRELGPVVFEMNYAEAIDLGVLPPFRIVHYGLHLREGERARYERASREISDLRAALEGHGRRGLELIRWCRSKAGASNPKAARLLGLTVARKRVLYRMAERTTAVIEILKRAFEQNPDCKAILFHESIDEVMLLFDALRQAGYAIVAEHSGFPDAIRAESLRLFRNGAAQIIVSARSLIEGFNVPSADLGIVVAASASVRQRVQTLGRLLRKGQRTDGHEKQAALFVLYAHDTVDELIYEKADWAQFVGADRNDYYVWPSVIDAAPALCPGPPRVPLQGDGAVDVASLKPGDVYPGDPNQGRLYTVDSQGTVRDEEGTLMKPHPAMRAIVASYPRPLGRFRVTPDLRLVIKLEKDEKVWRGIYLGRLEAPLEPADEDKGDEGAPVSYSPGDIYPLGRARGKTFSVLQRDKRLIAIKSRGGVQFVVPAGELMVPEKQAALRQIQRFLAAAYAKGHKISKLTVTAEGHVVYVFENVAYFVGHAPEGDEGFVFESL